MRKGIAFAGAITVAIAMVVFVSRSRLRSPLPARSTTAPAKPNSSAPGGGEVHPSLLYGRVRTVDGLTYQGRLRCGRGEEAFWGDYFNGVKRENPWAEEVPPDELPQVQRTIELFGFKIHRRPSPIDLGRPFMARFGDIARIEIQGRDVAVTLKSGAVFHLDRLDASDFDDGLQVWDAAQGEIDLDSLRIRSIDLLQSPQVGPPPDRLHGVVRSVIGTFIGTIQWDREQCLGSDELDLDTAGRSQRVRFDTIRSVARGRDGKTHVTLRDGRDITLANTTDAGPGGRGVYVDDSRYGRVLVSWNSLEQVEFTPAGPGPAYDDFPAGSPLQGTVTLHDSRRYTGRMVFDLDESEDTETLDAPIQGVTYTIPLGRIAAIVLPEPARTEPPGKGASAESTADSTVESIAVTLHPSHAGQPGEILHLERKGDLGKENAGMLIYVGRETRPAYVPWNEVARIDITRPKAAYPPLP